jgi:hypothetical protein
MPAIRVAVSIRPDEATDVACHVYPDRPPILVISAERHTLTVASEATATPAEMVLFADALVAASQRYREAVTVRRGEWPPDVPRMFPHRA